LYLYGKYFDEESVIQQAGRYKLSASFKRYWQVDLWNELFDLLLNPTLVRTGWAITALYRARVDTEKLEHWLQHNDRGIRASLQGLLRKIAIASERG